MLWCNASTEIRIGHVFATSVLLGGQQRTAKLATSESINNNVESQDNLSRELGVSVSAQYASLSANFGSERKRAAAEAEHTIGDLSQLAMTAHGGDVTIGPK